MQAGRGTGEYKDRICTAHNTGCSCERTLQYYFIMASAGLTMPGAVFHIRTAVKKKNCRFTVRKISEETVL